MTLENKTKELAVRLPVGICWKGVHDCAFERMIQSVTEVIVCAGAYR